jgi:hypothetical protein
MVMKNKTMKYSSRIGQKTGISKMPKKVMKKDVMTALMQECQNLNSGSRRANGLCVECRGRWRGVSQESWSSRQLEWREPGNDRVATHMYALPEFLVIASR